MGWLMVHSGLNVKETDRHGGVARVSQHRLAAHFTLAMGVFSLSLWTAMGLRRGRPQAVEATAAAIKALKGRTHGAVGLVGVTAVTGAYVAGLDAGKVYNTYPLMGGRLFPVEGLDQKPLPANFVDNPATVQFEHRWLATTTGAVVVSTALAARRLPWLPKEAKSAFAVMGGLVAWQVTLGITTLLHAAPVNLSSMHQMSAVALFWSGLRVLSALKRVVPI